MRVILLTLGSPAGTGVRDVARFLRKFLGDARVIRVPAFFRRLLVDLIIVPFYSWSAAKRYRRVWCPKENCSLQIAETRKLVRRLRERFPEHEIDFESFEDGGNVPADLFVPLYPHDTESCYRLLAGTRENVVKPYGNHPAFVKALCGHFEKLTKNIPATEVILSFHGIPADAPEAARYVRDCYETAELFAAGTALPPNTVRVGFQSKFGFKKWLEPSTKSLVENAPAGTVLIPAGFLCDCIETAEELGTLVAGTRVRLLPCLNESAADVIAEIIRGNKR